MRFLGLVISCVCLVYPVVGWAEDHVVVVVHKKAPEPVAAQAVVHQPAAAPAPMTIEEIYKRWETFPGQQMLDTPSGPVPLFGMDIVQDANGYPVPRLPDPYTYAVITNPGDHEAMKRYLDWRRAVIRRTRISMNRVPDAAYELGYVTPEVLEVAPDRPRDRMLVGDLSPIDKRSLGTPMMNAEKARTLGMEASEVPNLPGDVSASGIEVYWFWHQRCPFCEKTARDWFAFQRVVGEAGYKAMSVNVSPVQSDNQITNATIETAAILEIWTLMWGEDVSYSSNRLDFTESAQSLNIDRTPTFIFVNRKKGTIDRLEGPQSVNVLAEAFAKAGGWDPSQWPPPPATAGPTAIKAAATSEPLLNATPIPTGGP